MSVWTPSEGLEEGIDNRFKAIFNETNANSKQREDRLIGFANIVNQSQYQTGDHAAFCAIILEVCNDPTTIQAQSADQILNKIYDQMTHGAVSAPGRLERGGGSSLADTAHDFRDNAEELGHRQAGPENRTTTPEEGVRNLASAARDFRGQTQELERPRGGGQPEPENRATTLAGGVKGLAGEASDYNKNVQELNRQRSRGQGTPQSQSEPEGQSLRQNAMLFSQKTEELKRELNPSLDGAVLKAQARELRNELLTTGGGAIDKEVGDALWRLMENKDSANNNNKLYAMIKIAEVAKNSDLKDSTFEAIKNIAQNSAIRDGKGAAFKAGTNPNTSGGAKESVRKFKDSFREKTGRGAGQAKPSAFAQMEERINTATKPTGKRLR